MKKILLLSAFIVAIFQLSNAQVNADNELSVPNAKPSVKWENTILDAGDVKYRVPEKFIFKFTNTGNAPVVVTNARGSCGCTGIKYPHEPIKPGETGEVEAVYNSASMGMFQKTVTVSFDFEGSTTVLKLKGQVVQKS